MVSHAWLIVRTLCFSLQTIVARPAATASDSSDRKVNWTDWTSVAQLALRCESLVRMYLLSHLCEMSECFLFISRQNVPRLARCDTSTMNVCAFVSRFSQSFAAGLRRLCVDKYLIPYKTERFTSADELKITNKTRSSKHSEYSEFSLSALSTADNISFSFSAASARIFVALLCQMEYYDSKFSTLNNSWGRCTRSESDSVANERDNPSSFRSYMFLFIYSYRDKTETRYGPWNCFHGIRSRHMEKGMFCVLDFPELFPFSSFVCTQWAKRKWYTVFFFFSLCSTHRLFALVEYNWRERATRSGSAGKQFHSRLPFNYKWIEKHFSLFGDECEWGMENAKKLSFSSENYPYFYIVIYPGRGGRD